MGLIPDIGAAGSEHGVDVTLFFSMSEILVRLFCSFFLAGTLHIGDRFMKDALRSS